MITKEVKTQVIAENAVHEGDTGSPEVQIAILTQPQSNFPVPRALPGELFCVDNHSKLWYDAKVRARSLRDGVCRQRGVLSAPWPGSQGIANIERSFSP